MAGRSFTIAFTLLFLCLSFPLFHALEDDTDLSDGVQTLKVGMIRDLYLRYADQDSTIYRGVVYWVNYVNSQGGFPYPLFLMSGAMKREREWHGKGGGGWNMGKKKKRFLIKRRWGNKTLRIDPVITKEASTPDPKQLNNSIANAYPHSYIFTNRNYIKLKKKTSICRFFILNRCFRTSFYLFLFWNIMISSLFLWLVTQRAQLDCGLWNWPIC